MKIVFVVMFLLVNSVSGQTQTGLLPLSSNNLGSGLIDGEGIYFSAANLLARVDLINGGFLWQQVQTEHSWAFGLPVLRGQALVFHDAGEIDRSVEVEKATGRLIKH